MYIDIEFGRYVNSQTRPQQDSKAWHWIMTKGTCNLFETSFICYYSRLLNVHYRFLEP